jgi:hypothetical protein
VLIQPLKVACKAAHVVNNFILQILLYICLQITTDSLFLSWDCIRWYGTLLKKKKWDSSYHAPSYFAFGLLLPARKFYSLWSYFVILACSICSVGALVLW